MNGAICSLAKTVPQLGSATGWSFPWVLSIDEAIGTGARGNYLSQSGKAVITARNRRMELKKRFRLGKDCGSILT
jgi:hypothetical protein